MKPKLIIFDFDGVIANTEDIFFKILHKTLSDFGINMDFKTCCYTFAGKDTLTTLHNVAQKYNSNVSAHEIYEVLLKDKKIWMKQVTATPFIEDVLGSLKVPYCIASNSAPEHINSTLELIKLDHFFNSNNKFSAVTLGKFKPDPAVYLEALKKMGFSNNEAMVIEDSITGVQAAHAAKIPVIGYVGSNHVNKEEHSLALKQNGAFTTVNSFKEIIPLLV